MSYHSQHMNHPVTGIRSNVVVLSYDEMFKGITWENIKEKLVSPQEYGNSKFSDDYIIAYFFKNHFNLYLTSNEVGYKNVNNSTSNVVRRLERINTDSILNVARALIRNSLIDLSHITTVLEAHLNPHRKGPLSKTHKMYCKKIITSANKKNKTLSKTAKVLNTTVSVIKYWKNLKA